MNMRRFLIALLSLTALAVPAASWGVTTSANLAVIVMAPVAGGSGVCPRGTTDPNDGCQHAQATSSFQRSNFFTGYTGRNYGANRPPWNVAGVDYPVGYDTTATLADPLTAGTLPACATVSGHTVTVNSAPCTIQHFDFSLHSGMCLEIFLTGGNTVTVQNNKFGWGPNCNPAGGGMMTVRGNGNLVFKYNQVESSLSAQLEGIIKFNNTGTLTAEYNAFFNMSKDTFHGWPASTTVVTRYNYAENMGSPGVHANYTYMDGTQTWNSEYETILNTAAGCCTTALCQFELNPVTVPSIRCANNVLVSRPGGSSGNPTARLITVGYPSGDPTLTNLVIQNNYGDTTGTGGGGYFVIEGGRIINKTCTGNKDMTNGSTLTGRFGSGGNLVTCS
jgi:hypothetical protein